MHEGKKCHKCHVGEYRCSKVVTLKINVDSVHENNKSSICNISCETNTNLKQYIKAVHDKEKLLKCPSCEYENAY